MTVDLSTYEIHLLQGILGREVKETRQLRNRMAADDPFRKSLTSNIEYLDGLLGKLG